MGAKVALKAAAILTGCDGQSLGGLQNRYPERMENREKDFRQFGKDVCSRVVTFRR